VRFCIIAVALAGVIAFAQKADAAWVPQWGAHMNELSSTLMNDFVAKRDGQDKGVHLGVPGPAGHGTEPGVSGASGSSRPVTTRVMVLPISAAWALRCRLSMFSCISRLAVVWPASSCSCI
jgi:hypothetical protein